MVKSNQVSIPFLSIVIANYNGERYLETCIMSLLASSITNYEIIIIDNNSTDSSINIIKKLMKKDLKIKLLKNKINLGVPASRNIAISHCQGDIIVLLDNDTEVEYDSISKLIQPLLSDNNIGAAQALLLDFENREYIQMAGGHLIPQAIWLMGFYERQEYQSIKPALRNFNIIAISAALAVKKEVITKIGGYDQLLFNYTDDLDLSWRIWIAGYKIVLADQSIIYHYTKSVARRANIGANKYDIYFHLAKNSFRSIIKNYQTYNVVKYLPASLFVNLSRAILVLLRRGDLSALLGTVSGIWWNILNLPDSMQSRSVIQENRKWSDKKILSQVFVKGSLLEIYHRNYRNSKLLW